MRTSAAWAVETARKRGWHIFGAACRTGVRHGGAETPACSGGEDSVRRLGEHVFVCVDMSVGCAILAVMRQPSLSACVEGFER